MTGKNDDRPVPRKRTPRPAPDANADPMDPPAAAIPAPAPSPAPAASTPEPAKSEESAESAVPSAKPARASSRRTVPSSVSVTPKDPEDRAVVQLGVRVGVKVDQHLEEVRLATGRTRRELVESAIMALRVP